MKYRITARYGGIDGIHHRPHTGIDFSMNKGEPIRAIHDGTINVVDYGNSNIGKGVLNEWGNDTHAIYGHMSKVVVHDGQHVNKGDLLGYAGSTGHSSGNHLHFGIKSHGQFINPSAYIDDIQHMNDKINHHIHYIADKGNIHDIIHSQMNIYSDLAHNIKINFIHIFYSIDYSIFIQYIQHFFKFFSG